MKTKVLLAICCCFFLNAVQNPPSIPWLTGPLIAPQPTVVPYGRFLVKSYLFFRCAQDCYNEDWPPVIAEQNFYSLNPRFDCYFGLTPWCDINVTPQFAYQWSWKSQYIYAGDLSIGLDFQLLDPSFTSYFPGIKLAVREIFPTGKYEFLTPRKVLTDQTGLGTFATQFDLVFYKLAHLIGTHWLSSTLSAEYTICSAVNVHGFNAYGGGFGTKGHIFGGNRFQGILSFEWSLNQRWALIWENIYTHRDGTEFCGMDGISFKGQYALVGTSASNQLSFSAGLEYNLSDHFGIAAGYWFSAWSDRCPRFQSGVMNFNYGY